jgi:RNA polymerase sigma factor (sigma-70 family)
MTTESRLWEEARLGDGGSFGALYDKHRDRVFRQALRSTESRHDAEDITAMVFLEAWRKRDTVRLVDGSIVAWLLVTTNYVASNASRTARRHRIALAKLPAQPDVEDHSDAVLDDIEAEVREATMRAAFVTLPKMDRNVLTLCIINGFPLAQAAEILDVPLGTVKSRLSRAKQRLAALTGSFDAAGAPAHVIGELS